MGCRKLEYYGREALGETTKNLEVVYAKKGMRKKKCINYYPGGSLQPGRSFSSNSYRYGFQGQEKDDEIKGNGNSINYKYRMHDPRLVRFFAVDPLASKYPFYSPYAFSGNRMIDAVELEGLEPAKFDRMIANRVAPQLNMTSDEFIKAANPLNDAVEFIQDNEFSTSVNLEVTAGAQMGGSVTVAGMEVGLKGNLGSVVLGEGKLEKRADTPLMLTGNHIFDGDGKTRVEQDVTVGIGIASIKLENTFDAHRSGSSNHKVSGKLGLGPVKFQKQKNLDTGEINNSIGTEFGVKAAFLVGFDFKVKFEVTDKKQSEGIIIDPKSIGTGEN